MLQPRSTLLVAAVLGLLAWVPCARGEEGCPPTSWVRVVDLTKEARILLDGHRYDEAIAKLRSAYGICPEPKLRRSMGRVYEEAGRPEEALAAFRACIDEKAEASVRSECEERARKIQEHLDSATLIVDAIPPNATVLLDGLEEPHPAGQSIRVRPGRHNVELRAAGKSAYQTTVVAAGGQETRISVLMEAFPAPPEPPRSRETARAPPDSPAEAPSTQLQEMASASSPEARWNWVGVGLGAAVTGLGMAFLIQYGLDKKNAQGQHQDATYVYAADEVGPRNLALGLTFAVIGVAGVVVSGVLWPKVPVKASVGLVPGGGSLAVSFDL